MVVYDLICESQHQFEGWFRSSEDFTSQKQAGLLRCPVCESSSVIKLPSASYINLGRDNSSSPTSRSGSDSKPLLATLTPHVVEKIREYIENNTENVGRDFFEEARKIHYGEAADRNIRGEATLDEMNELHEEGINTVPLPFSFPAKKKLN